MPSFHSAGTLPVDHTLVTTLCKASLIGFSAPFRSSAVMPSAPAARPSRTIFTSPLADNFLYRGLVRVNAYKCATFQRPGSISFRDKEDVPKFNLLALCRTPYAETFMCAQSNSQGKTACQISASYLYASCSYANMYFP